MSKIRATVNDVGRTSQGDIFRDVEYVEHAIEDGDAFEISKIIFPLVVVLTQDCDLNQNSGYAATPAPSNDDKRLFSVLVAPLYNAEHVYAGTHLSDLNMTMAKINKTKSEGKFLRRNERPRYHYLDFPRDIPVVESVVDFKHYFSVNAAYLDSIRSERFVCHVSELYRESLSYRFAFYLARIGLPDDGIASVDLCARG